MATDNALSANALDLNTSEFDLIFPTKEMSLFYLCRPEPVTIISPKA